MISVKIFGICVVNEIEVLEKLNYIIVFDIFRIKSFVKVVLIFFRSYVGSYVMKILADNM